MRDEPASGDGADREPSGGEGVRDGSGGRECADDAGTDRSDPGIHLRDDHELSDPGIRPKSTASGDQRAGEQHADRDERADPIEEHANRDERADPIEEHTDGGERADRVEEQVGTARTGAGEAGDASGFAVPDGGGGAEADADPRAEHLADLDKDPFEEFLDDYFEPTFFMTRYVILIPVLLALLGSVIVFGLGSYYTYEGVLEIVNGHYSKVDLKIIKALDAFLLGLILIIFSFGVYDFFVSELEPAEEAGIRPDWLKFETVGELKNKVVEVVIVILAILFYEQMKAITSFQDVSNPMPLLLIPIGTVLLAFAVGSFKYLTH